MSIGHTPKSQLYAGSFYNQQQDDMRGRDTFEEESSFVDEAAMADAAEAIREVEVEAGEPEAGDLNNNLGGLNKEKLLHMNIDELRSLAKQLGIPHREQITERDELLAAIQRSL